MKALGIDVAAIPKVQATDQIGTPRELISADRELAWSSHFTP